MRVQATGAQRVPLRLTVVRRYRYRDFINNVPSYSLPSVARTEPLVPAERIRFTYGYITTPKIDDGLGICVGAPEWNRLEGIMCLQDEKFNHKWLTEWSTRKLGLGFSLAELEDVKNQVSPPPLPRSRLPTNSF